MGLTKILAFAGIIGAMTFLPTKNYAQNMENEKRCKIIFENPIPKKQFFTKNFIKYLDNLENTKGKKDRFYFNEVKSCKGSMYSPLPEDKPLLLTRNFYLDENDEHVLYINLDFIEKNGKAIEKDNVLGMYSLDKKQEVLSQIYKLFKKRILQKKGLKKTGIWKNSKKYYKDSKK